MDRLIKEIFLNEIENKTLNEIFEIVREERGIPAQISSYVCNIYEDLRKNIETTPTSPNNIKFTTFKKGEFKTIVFNRTIKFQWFYYSFATEKLKKETRLPLNTGTLIKVNEENYILKIIIKAVKGNIIYSPIMETISHELFHLWEIINSPKSPKGKKLGDYSEELKNSVNEYENYVGDILYLSRKYEQNAYANGVYEYLMNHTNSLNPRDNIKETQLYNGLIHLKIAVFELKKHLKDYNEYPLTRNAALKLKKIFGLDYQQVINLGEQSIKNITKALGRTLSKVEDDLKKKHSLHTPYYENINLQ